MSKRYQTKTIDDLLVEIGQDKYENLSTTSFLFKQDLWEFFTEDDRWESANAVEFGTHKGQTTRILSYLFDHVYTINLPKHFYEAEILNRDRDNITYVGMDLYGDSLDKNFVHRPISVVFIDAIHTFDAVLMDFARSKKFKLTEEVYYIFDDYGLVREVYQAVNQLIYTNQVKRVRYIGHPPRHSFGGRPERLLLDHEGIICKLV